MRVLLVGPYPPPHGGVQTHVVAIRGFLRARGIPCVVVNITRHRKTNSDDVYYPKSALGLIGVLLRLKYDIIHLHFGGDLTGRLLALGLVCTLMPRAKTVLTFHSGGYPSSTEGKAAAYWTVRGFVLRRFDAVVGVNAQLVEMFRRFGVLAARTRAIAPHAVVDRQAGDPRDMADSLRRFYQTHSPVLLTVGGFEPEYVIPAQLDMLGSLREKLPNAGLVVIGSGSLERDTREYARTKPYAEHALLCGDVPHAATLLAIAQADLLLRPTLYDGDSIAVREALHLGTPVLATDNGMRPSGVHLMTDVSPEAFSCRVMECLQRPTASPQNGEEGEQNLEAVLRLYSDLRPDLRPQQPATVWQ